MGGDFTFIGNQYHLIAGNRDLYIDLLLFHRRIRSLIAIELKIGEFEAEYAGKMQLYLTVLDEQVKLPEENPSIGIIICKSKDLINSRACPMPPVPSPCRPIKKMI